MNTYDFVKYLKKVESNRCVIIKNGYFYQVFDEDALVLNYLFNFKIIQVNDTLKKVGFPKTSIDRVKNELSERQINYVVIDDVNNIYEKNFNNNNYEELFKIVVNKYSYELKLENIVRLIKEKSSINPKILDKIEGII